MHRAGSKQRQTQHYLQTRQPAADAHITRGPHHAFKATEWLLKNRAVEEEEGAEGLILRRSRHVALYGQVCQERVDLCYAHVERMALVVEEHEATSPADVGLAGIR